jgi:hypothetical protein
VVSSVADVLVGSVVDILGGILAGILAGILTGVLADSVVGVPVGIVADVLVSLTDAGGSPPCPQRLHQLQELQARQAEGLEWRVVRRALRVRAG